MHERRRSEIVRKIQNKRRNKEVCLRRTYYIVHVVRKTNELLRLNFYCFVFISKRQRNYSNTIKHYKTALKIALILHFEPGFIFHEYCLHQIAAIVVDEREIRRRRNFPLPAHLGFCILCSPVDLLYANVLQDSGCIFCNLSFGVVILQFW